MKAVLCLLLIICAVVLFVLFGPSGGTDKEQIPSPASTQQAGTQQQQQQQPQRQTTSIREDVESAMGYGVGYTQFKAKQRSQQRLGEMQDKHNAEMEKLMDE